MQFGHGLLHPPEACPYDSHVRFTSVILCIALEIAAKHICCGTTNVLGLKLKPKLELEFDDPEDK